MEEKCVIKAEEEEGEQECPFCFSTQRIIEHHIIPRKLGGSDNPENSTHVCTSCHGTLENMTKKHILGFLGWSTEDIEKTLKIYEKAKPPTEEGEKHRRMLVFMLEVVIPKATARWVTKR